ncbi:MAG: hypothetical protein FD136_1939 [Chitinophagaceae bacterium]|nr:MAG: hypothetical protein FD136_1939 [Chitinophagaceae bacterium]
MKSRKGLVLTTIVLFGALFFAFRNIGTNNGVTEMVTLQQRLLKLFQKKYLKSIWNN